jgi:hypothetical protein
LRGSTRKSQELLDTPETLEEKATLDAVVSDRAGLTDAGFSRVMRRAARASRRDTRYVEDLYARETIAAARARS